MAIDNERYNRQIILSEIGIEGQKKIANAAVLVVGAGGLGSSAALYLTAAGVGRLGIIDDDTVSISNLQRQILYRENELNLSKAECARDTLNRLNSSTVIDVYDFKLTSENADSIISKYDLIVDGTDNYQTRYLINDTCVSLDKIYIYGAIAQFCGQVSVFNYNGGATYRTLYPDEHEMPAHSRGVVGMLPGIIGCIEASEAIKIITGAGDVLSGKLFTIDLLTMRTNLFDI